MEKHLKTLQECKDEAAKEFNEAFYWTALENGVHVGNIKFHHYKKAVDRAAELYAQQYKDEIKRLKEESKTLQTTMSNLLRRLAEDGVAIPEFAESWRVLLEQTSKDVQRELDTLAQTNRKYEQQR